MKFHVMGLGCLLALAASGCSSFGAEKPHRPATYPPTDTRGAYPPWRLIGIKNNPKAPCPEIPGWKVRPLFQLHGSSVCTEDDERGLGAVEEQMDRFCLYEQGKGPRTIPQASALGLAHLEPDAVAMAPAVQVPGKSGPMGRAIWPQLETHFVEQTTGGSLPKPFPNVQAHRPVRLAFIDSEPASSGLDRKNPYMEHGHFLRLLGYKLAGSSVEITTELALPIVAFNTENPDASDRDLTNGGRVGSFDDLAEAIQRAVIAWQSEGKKYGQKLVLNLSVGWDGKRFGGLTEQRVCDLPAGPQAVYLALEYAAREGALIFAAAGNSRSGPHASSGPLLPAAWARGNIGESGCGKELKQPLLYAVGGVQWDGKPITNARTGGMPSLAAYADHVALRDLDGNPTSTYTGTSVATAVVSSIASRLWPDDLGTDASAIVEKLPGVLLDYKADFYRDENAPNVKEVSLCPAGAPDCPPRVRPNLSAAFDARKPPVEHRSFQDIETPSDCGAGLFFELQTMSSHRAICPSKKYDDFWDEPWILPQPESDPCPSCAIGPRTMLQTGTDGLPPEQMLHIEISEEWQKAADSEAATLASGTLEVVREEATPRFFHYVFDPPNPGSALDIKLPGEPFASGSTVRASISWEVRQSTKTYSINTPVLISN